MWLVIINIMNTQYYCISKSNTINSVRYCTSGITSVNLNYCNYRSMILYLFLRVVDHVHDHVSSYTSFSPASLHSLSPSSKLSLAYVCNACQSHAIMQIQHQNAPVAYHTFSSAKCRPKKLFIMTSLR